MSGNFQLYSFKTNSYLIFSSVFSFRKINPFLADGLNLNAKKNQRFSGLLKGYKMGTLAKNRLTAPEAVVYR